MNEQGSPNRRTRRAQRKRGAVASELPEEVPSAGSEERAETEQIRERGQKARQAAMERRRTRRKKERRVAAAQGLDATEMVDDALARASHKAAQVLKRHFSLIQWLIVGGIAIGVGISIYQHRAEANAERASDALMQGLEAEIGRVKSESLQVAPYDTGLEDTRTTFSDDKERLRAAEKGYREAIKAHPKAKAATLARLGLAGTLYELGNFKEALSEYEGVKNGTLAAKDGDLRGRALEGIGLSHEGQGDQKAALKAFRALENSDIFGFAPLGQYHQARLLFAEGKRDQAKALLIKAKEKLAKIDEAKALGNGYVATAVQQLLETIDPSQRPAPQQITPEQLAELQKWVESGSKGKMPPLEGLPQAPPGPSEEGSAEPASDESSSAEKSATERSGVEKPGTEQPAAEKPAGEKPAGEKPGPASSAAEKPAPETPSPEKGAAQKPASGKPAPEKPAGEPPQTSPATGEATSGTKTEGSGATPGSNASGTPLEQR